MAQNPHATLETRERWEEGYVGVRRGLWLRRRRLARLVLADPDALVAEIGCGDGLNLAVLTGLGFRRVLGFEFSPALLARAPRGRTAAADAQLMPVGTASLDAVVIDNVLHHLPDYRAGASELARVLKPGGRLFCIEPRPGTLRRLLDWATFTPALARRVAYLRSRRQTIAEEWDLYSRWLAGHGEMEALLEAAGLRPLSRRKGPLGFFFTYAKPHYSM